MNTKIAGILAGSVIVLMALAPMGLAHVDNGSAKPTGNYVGAAGPWVRIDGDDIFAGNAFCDLEVLSDGDEGTSDDNFADEPDVDHSATTGTSTEGDWDDGGFGAVCHTPNTHYVNNGQTVGTTVYPDMNTQECSYTPAVANDDVFTGSAGMPDVWASTGCDYITNVPSTTDPSLVDFVLDAAGCVVNAVITVNALEIVTGCVDRLTDCLLGQSLDGTADTCPAGAGGQACLPDGTIDAGDEGPGSAGVAYPSSYPYAPTPTTTGNCISTNGVASVFLWDAVDVDTVGQTHTEYAASTGSVS